MTYGSIDAIKSRLKIVSTITTYDSEMTLALAEASRYIDLKLRQYTTITPSTVGTLTLADIEADYGAALFRQRMIPANTRLSDNILSSEDLFINADKKLSEYVKAYYRTGQFYFIESGTIGYQEQS